MRRDRGRLWRGSAIVLLATLTLQTLAMAGDGVHVLDQGAGRYTLSTALTGTNDPDQGTIAIAPEAAALCGELFPHFGRYRLEAQAPLVGKQDPTSTKLEYAQEITCRDVPQQPSAGASDPVPPAPESPPTESDTDVIRGLTLTYLAAKQAADSDIAYALLSNEMASYGSPESWAVMRGAFNAQVGEGAQANVVRITWYDNPAGAPVPGRYAAADYDVAYPSKGFTCGYVMWLRQADGHYLIVREEEAQATPDSVANLSAAQVAGMRAQLQCRD